jgi:hypothetical protein
VILLAVGSLIPERSSSGGRTIGGFVKTRKWLAAAFGALALGAFSILGNVYMALPAHAQPLAQARQVTSAARAQSALNTFEICTWLDHSECLRSHGGGSQLTIESSDYASFHFVNTGETGSKVQLEDTGGKCLRSFADGSVGLATGGCSTSNDEEEWNYDANTQGRSIFFQYQPPGTPGPLYMGTYGTSSGLGVWMDVPRQGFDSGWFISG